MQVLGQRLPDALAPQNDDDTDILEVLQCFVWSNTLFFLFTIRLLTDDVIKDVCDVITLI